MRKLIAITGGIGSGKSSVLEILQSNGYTVMNSDKIVSELYQKRKVKKMLKGLFPNAVTGFINLKINRRKIAEAVFSDQEKHKALTDAVTPLVMNEIEKRAKKLNVVCFAEVPLLFECNYQNRFDGVWVITRPVKERIESVITRSNLTEQEIVSRMNKQVDYDNKDLSNYTVIENTGDVKELAKKVLTLASSL